MEVKPLFIFFLILAIFLVSCAQETWHTVSTNDYSNGWDEVKTSQFKIKGKIWKINYTMQFADYGCVTYYYTPKQCAEHSNDPSKFLPAILSFNVYKKEDETFKLVEARDFAHNQNEVTSGSFTLEGKGTYYLVIRHSNALSTITIEDYY